MHPFGSRCFEHVLWRQDSHRYSKFIGTQYQAAKRVWRTRRG